MSELKSNMIMKWTDLVPGDILRYNPEYIKEVRRSQNLYADEKDQFIDNENVDLIISYIKFYNDNDRYNAGCMRINFYKSCVWGWLVSCDKCVAQTQIYIFGDIPVFIIHDLLED